jgi:hypothetical protein
LIWIFNGSVGSKPETREAANPLEQFLGSVRRNQVQTIQDPKRERLAPHHRIGIPDWEASELLASLGSDQSSIPQNTTNQINDGNYTQKKR